MSGCLWLGTLVINWGIRKGLVTTVSSGSDGPRFTGVYKEEDRPIAGHQTVAVDAVDSLALHMGVVGIAVCIGYILKRCLLLVEGMARLCALHDPPSPSNNQRPCPA